MFYTFKPCNIKPKNMVKCTQTGNCKRPEHNGGKHNKTSTNLLSRGTNQSKLF